MKIRFTSQIQIYILCSLLLISTGITLLDVKQGIVYDEKTTLAASTGNLVSDNYDSIRDSFQIPNFVPPSSRAFNCGVFLNRDNYQNIAAASISDIDWGKGLPYAFFLNLWIRLFGLDDVTIRLSAIFFSLLITFVIFRIALFFSEGNIWMALFATFLGAIHPIFWRFNIEIRPYALATLLSLLSTWIFYLIFFEKQKGLIYFLAYSASILLSFLAHYHTLYVILPQFIFFFLFTKDRSDLLKFIASIAFASFVILLWMFAGGGKGLQMMEYCNRDILNSVKKITDVSDYTHDALPVSIRNLLVYSLYDFSELLNTDALLKLSKLKYFFPVFLYSGWLFYKKYSVSGQPARIKVFFLLLLCSSPFLLNIILALISGHTTSLKIRFFAFSAPYFVILLALSSGKIFLSSKDRMRLPQTDQLFCKI